MTGQTLSRPNHCAGVRVHAIAEVAHSDHILEHAEDAAVTIGWMVAGNGRSASLMAETAISYEPPPGDGYVWFAGEASVGRSLRKHFRGQQQMEAHRLALVGCWRDDKERWLTRYHEQSDALLADYERAATGARTEAEAEIYWDEILERAGL